MVKVLFVCSGNICRSPTAEGIFRHLVEQAGLVERITVDSAGTHGFHSGEPPDRRSVAAAALRGYDLSGLRARQVRQDDCLHFDWVIAMGEDHRQHLLALCPPALRQRIRLMRSFDAAAAASAEVPDPYYGGGQGFETVLDLLETACAGLLAEIRRQHDLAGA